MLLANIPNWCTIRNALQFYSSTVLGDCCYYSVQIYTHFSSFFAILSLAGPTTHRVASQPASQSVSQSAMQSVSSLYKSVGNGIPLTGRAFVRSFADESLKELHSWPAVFTVVFFFTEFYFPTLTCLIRSPAPSSFTMPKRESKLESRNAFIATHKSHYFFTYSKLVDRALQKLSLSRVHAADYQFALHQE